MANGGAELKRAIAVREARKPPSTVRLSSSSRAAVFMTSPLKTMARLTSPISPTMTGPKCRLPRIRGTVPNSRSNWLDASDNSSRIATKQRSGRQSTAPSALPPGHDHLVADIIENLAAIVHDRKREEAKGTIQQTVNGDAAEPLGEPGRSRDVDEQYEAIFLDRGMIPPREEVQERARPDDVGDTENEIGQNQERNGIDD
jgi:hypothetical protein